MTDQGRLPTRTLACSKEGIWLYLGDPRRQLGQIIGHLVPAPKCCALTELAETVGRPFERACQVANAALVDEHLCNRGYGVQLYVDLAKAAAKHFQAPIFASKILGGVTSDEALRVWKSRRLAQALLVSGVSAWPRGDLEQS